MAPDRSYGDLSEFSLEGSPGWDGGDSPSLFSGRAAGATHSHAPPPPLPSSTHTPSSSPCLSCLPARQAPTRWQECATCACIRVRSYSLLD